eukprot:3998664-Heterocapsa_arctica.AAC.1
MSGNITLKGVDRHQLEAFHVLFMRQQDDDEVARVRGETIDLKRNGRCRHHMEAPNAGLQCGHQFALCDEHAG